MPRFVVRCYNGMKTNNGLIIKLNGENEETEWKGQPEELGTKRAAPCFRKSLFAVSAQLQLQLTYKVLFSACVHLVRLALWLMQLQLLFLYKTLQWAVFFFPYFQFWRYVLAHCRGTVDRNKKRLFTSAVRASKSRRLSHTAGQHTTRHTSTQKQVEN